VELDPGLPNNRQQQGLGESVPTARNALLWTLAGTALGLALLYASTRKVDAGALIATLRSVDWPWIAAILAATTAFCAIKAWRWGLLLKFVRDLTFRELHSAVYAGLAVNFLVAHVGEFLRAATVARNRRVSTSAVLASVIVERVLDFVALLVLLSLIAVAVPNRPAAVTTAAAISVVVVVVMLGGLISLMHPPAWSVQLASRLGRLLTERLHERIREQLDRFRAGLSAMRDPGLLLQAVILSVLQWVLVIAAIWASARAVGPPATLIATTVTLVLIVVGLALPNSPLQIGATQLAFVVGLGTDGTGVTPAIAASLVYTSFLILPIMLAGGIALLRGPANPREIREARDRLK
jgi:glycosyltransferase 2 family protein